MLRICKWMYLHFFFKNSWVISFSFFLMPADKHKEQPLPFKPQIIVLSFWLWLKFTSPPSSEFEKSLRSFCYFIINYINLYYRDPMTVIIMPMKVWPQTIISVTTSKITFWISHENVYRTVFICLDVLECKTNFCLCSLLVIACDWHHILI